MNNGPHVEVSGLRKSFASRGSGAARIEVVKGISFSIEKGKSLALVGASGSGKSTTARCVLRLTESDSGSIRIGGTDVLSASKKKLVRLRTRAQFVFQDPYTALNPRMTTLQLIEEPLVIHFKSLGARGRELKVAAALEEVGLSKEFFHRRPAAMSGGQLQRVVIARALITEPDFLVLDEPTSALDVSVRAEVLGLLQRLQRDRALTTLYISHDLRSVRQVCDTICILHEGLVIESGETNAILENPSQLYTQRLLAAELPLPVAGQIEPQDSASPVSWSDQK